MVIILFTYLMYQKQTPTNIWLPLLAGAILGIALALWLRRKR